MTETVHDVPALPFDPAADVPALIDLLIGIIPAQVLHALAALGIPDQLADGALSAQEVAERAGTHPRSTYRLMRAAASVGLLRYEGDRRFSLTGQGHLLRTGIPGSLRALTLVQTGRLHWQSWTMFPESVRQGTCQAKQVLGADSFDYLARPENAAEAALFAESMADLSALTVAGAVAALDIAGALSAVDVGGADGQFVLALMAAHPELSGQVLDLPHAAERARAHAERRGLSDRFTAVAGDFFEAIPAADLYLLKTVLHDWDDERAAAILRNCRDAAHAGGRLFVVETALGEIGEPDFAALSDMGMLAVTGGVERAFEEFDALFAASGWQRGRTYPVGGGYFGMELAAV